jgi:hypothetical protein
MMSRPAILTVALLLPYFIAVLVVVAGEWLAVWR